MVERTIDILVALADSLSSQLSASINAGISYDMKPELSALHEGINALRDLAAAYRAVCSLREAPGTSELVVCFADSEVEDWAQ